MTDKNTAAKIIISGAYCTKFGELYEKTFEDLLKEAAEKALENACLKAGDIDMIIVGNMLSGEYEGQSQSGSLLASLLGIKVPALRVEAACASGGMAVFMARQAILSGSAKRVLVLGIEKMTGSDTSETEKFLMQAASQNEREAGFSFPAIYGFMAEKYRDFYGFSNAQLRECLSDWSIKMHSAAYNQEKAHFKKIISHADIKNSRLVADHLRVLDCAPISDGAAAIVLENFGSYSHRSSNRDSHIFLHDSEVQSDTLSLLEREFTHGIPATRKAAAALGNRGFEVEKADILECHDCFSIAGIFALEDLGFAKKGSGGALNGKTLVNPSGGLKAFGHPVGASGVKQIVFCFESLLAHPNLNSALTHNVGGSGASVVLHVLKNE